MRSPTFNDLLGFQPPVIKGSRCSQSALATAGYWAVQKGHALSLRPQRAGVLRVGRGRVWVSLVGPHGHSPTDSGDWVGLPGQTLSIAAGQHAVVEALDSCDASLAWDFA